MRKLPSFEREVGVRLSRKWRALQQSLLVERFGLLDGLRHRPEAAATARVGLLTATLAGPNSLCDDPLNIGMACTPDVLTNRSAIVTKAIAERNGIVGLLDANPNGKRVLGDQVIAECGDVDYIATRRVTEIVGLRSELSQDCGGDQMLHRLARDRLGLLPIDGASWYISLMGKRTARFDVTHVLCPANYC